VGTYEDGIREILAGEVGMLQFIAHEANLAQIAGRIARSRVELRGRNSRSVTGFRLIPKVRPADIGPGQVGIRQGAAHKHCTSKVRIAKIGVWEAGLIELCTAEVLARKICSGKIDELQAQTHQRVVLVAGSGVKLVNFKTTAKSRSLYD